MHVLGIDIGSSFIKSSILDLERGVVGDTHIVPAPGFVEAQGNIREIPIDALTCMVKGIIDKSFTDAGLDGIIFSTQMHGYVLLDESGKPTGNYVSWQDMRGLDFSGGNGGDAIAAINARVPGHVLSLSGVTLRNNLSLVPLFCARQKGEIRENLSLAMLGDAMIRFLTGTGAPVHPTNAASTGLYNLKANDWNNELIKILDLGVLAFPRVYGGKEPAAFYEHSSGKRVPIYAAVGDHQAAIFGANAGDGCVVINIGTGGQICYIDKGLQYGNFETRPYFNGMSLRVLPQLPSGRSLNILMDFIVDVGTHLFDAADNGANDSSIWDRINKLAEQAEGESAGNGPAPLTVKMDFFNFNSSQGGAIEGIGTNNFNAGNLFRSVYAFMAGEYRAAYERLFAEGEKKASMVVCTGGVLQKTPLLVKKISECFDVPCMPASATEDVMNGLMRLARWYDS